MTKLEVTDAMLEAVSAAVRQEGWPWTTTQFPAEAAIARGVHRVGRGVGKD